MLDKQICLDTGVVWGMAGTDYTDGAAEVDPST